MGEGNPGAAGLCVSECTLNLKTGGERRDPPAKVSLPLSTNEPHQLPAHWVGGFFSAKSIVTLVNN